MSETQRTAGMGLTPAEQAFVERNEAAWRKVEATPEFRAMEASVEARIESSRLGEGHVVHELTAADRAVAMQQAREQAFNSSASVDYEARRYSQTETAKFTL